MILVTGATGFLGRYIVEELLANGLPVRVMVRNAQHPALDAWKGRVEVVQGNLDAPGTLQDVVRGVERIIHAGAVVSFVPRDRELLRQTNGIGTGNLVNAALEAGVQKLVYVSSVAALGRPEQFEGTYTEDSHWTESSRNSWYGYSKYLGEKEVARGVEEGLKAAIVNPTIIFGAGNWNEGSAKMFRTVRKGMPFYPKGGNGFVGAADVARATRLLVLDDRYNEAERFILCAENLPYRDVLTAIAHSVGRKAPSYAIPYYPGLAAGYLLGALAALTGTTPIVTAETIRTSSSVSRYDNSRLIKAFDFAYEPIASVIAQTGAALLAQKV